MACIHVHSTIRLCLVALKIQFVYYCVLIYFLVA